MVPFSLLLGWYHQCRGKIPHPTCHDLSRIRSEFKTLYQADPPTGDPLPIHISHVSIDDDAPHEPLILCALKWLQQGKMPGPSGIRVHNILYWHSKHPDLWHKLVLMVQDCFIGNPIPQAFLYEILCLIPKPEQGKYHGIAL